MKDPRIIGALVVIAVVVIIKLVAASWPEQYADSSLACPGHASQLTSPTHRTSEHALLAML